MDVGMKTANPFGFFCIMDVSAEGGIENYHVAGHNAQTVLTDIETVIALESDPERKGMLQVIWTQCSNMADELFALWGKCHCPDGEFCKHDHRRSLEGQAGDNQKIAEDRLAEVVEQVRAKDSNSHNHHAINSDKRPSPEAIARSML